MKTQIAQRQEIPFVDLQAQWRTLSPEMGPAITRVLDSANFILSPEVKTFEDAFAAYVGVKHCIGVGSGTDAIQIALEAMGIGEGDEVLVPTNTYVATVSAIHHTGAKPVFTDIDTATMFMDLQDAASKLTARTKAIIPVHLYGRVMDLTQLIAWAKEKGLRVIEDACQAHGAWLGQKMAGNLGSDAAAFSFYPGKNLGCYGDGGAAVTNNPKLALIISELRNQGQREKYIHNHIGYNSRLDSLQAAVLGVKLRHLDEWNNARRRWASFYDANLSGISGLTLPSWNKSLPREHVFHLYVVRTPERDRLLNHLRANGVAAQIHYPIPVHLQEGYAKLGSGKGSLPRAEKTASEILSLPLFPELGEGKAGYVAAQVREFFGK